MMLSLNPLCEEMHLYARRIELPADMVPSCNKPDDGGLHVELSPDGTKYVLTYSEKGTTDTLKVSADKEEILEVMFDELTTTLSAERGATRTIAPYFPPSAPSNEELRVMAIKSQTRLAAGQEALLFQIKPEWARRQAVRNAAQLQHIKDMFNGVD